MKTQNLTELFAALKAGEIELSDDLPVFAEPDWNNPVGTWSWDATNAIVGTCLNDLEIVSRELRATDALREIEETLSGDALAWWNGVAADVRDEYVVVAQRDGVAAAVGQINAMATD